MKKKKAKFLIGGILIFLLIGYLGYTGARDTMTYYLTIPEVMEKGAAIYGESIRVGGEVQDGSVQWDPKKLILKFTVVEENEKIQVVYNGVAPDSFKTGEKVIVEGIFQPTGIFVAEKLFPTCPSRYGS
jgi:cytochrome c-type biogenesis protein CcmE